MSISIYLDLYDTIYIVVIVIVSSPDRVHLAVSGGYNDNIEATTPGLALRQWSGPNAKHMFFVQGTVPRGPLAHTVRPTPQ